MDKRASLLLEEIIMSEIKAHELIEQAAKLVAGDRARSHGDKRTNMQNIASLWGAYLGPQLSSPITPEQVAWMMVLLKVARSSGGTKNPDNAVDAAGYAGIAGELMGDE